MHPNLLIAELYDDFCKNINKTIENLKQQRDSVTDKKIKDELSCKISGYVDSKKIMQQSFLKMIQK